MTDLFGGSPELTSDADRDVLFLDTTLRDGEQAPGVSLSADGKAAIARDLDSAGVDAVTGGTDAAVAVEVEVEVARGDRSVSAGAGAPDITRASVVAMVDAVDRLLAEREGAVV